MRMLFVFTLMVALSGCATFAPPQPPACDNSMEGMRPINPDMLTADQLADWEEERSRGKKSERAGAEKVEVFQ